MSDLFVSIDIGGTTIQAAISRSGTDLDQTFDFQLKNYENPATWLQDLFKKIPRSSDSFWAVAVPGSVKERRYLLETPNLPDAWCGSAIPTAFENADLNWVLENDANAAALGEAEFGSGRGANHLVCLTLGTGLGSGIIIDGDIYRGASGAAGEFGHFQIEPDGRLCGCGSRGCLETYASATGLVETYYGLTGNRPTAREIMDRVKEEEDAVRAARQTGLYLGRGLAQLINLLEPEKIIFAGGLSGSLDILLPHIREAAEPLLFAERTKNTPLVQSELDYPALHGGIALARRQG